MSTKIFSSIRIPKVKRNKFDLTHQSKLTTEFGRLTPFCCIETVPGDKFKMSCDVLMRMMPLATPVMANFDVTTHFFFVPQRLVWSEWQDFITGGKSGKLNPPIPKIKFDSLDFVDYKDYIGASSLANYLGLPPINVDETYQMETSLELDARPFKAYQLIYNEYYRDENQINEVDIHADWSGSISVSQYIDLLKIRQRAWKKDYFTSALPWPEQGGEGMPIPIKIEGASVTPPSSQIVRIQTAMDSRMSSDMTLWYRDSAGNYSQVKDGTQLEFFSNADGSVTAKNVATEEMYDRLAFDNAGVLAVNSTNLQDYIKQCKVNVDLTGNTTTINDFRRALAAQKWLEAAARGGHRYIEAILSHFGVRSSDARLQRPEYLGGGKVGVNIGDVLQTSQTTDGEEGSPLGQYAGVGATGSHIEEFTKYFEEHGYIIGIVSVMPRADYFQGIPRMFLRNDRYDYYWPEFAHIGEQPIYNAELYYDYKKGIDTDTFGYTPRYAEYKYIPNRIAGSFSDTSDEIMSRWHDARVFSKAPTLGQTFLEVYGQGQKGINRIFTYGADTTDHLMFQIQNNISALRPMPKFGTPLI